MCLEVDQDLALCFIDMLEQVEIAGGARLRSSLATSRGEMGVMEALARRERVFDGVPAEVMANVVSEPASDPKGIPLNRRRRNRMKRGFVLHLYAGEKDGYTLQRALKEVGGDTTRLVEIDLKRGDNHDMLSGPLYPSFLRAALDGNILGVVGGPNCRSRSVLRHYPLPAFGGSHGRNQRGSGEHQGGERSWRHGEYNGHDEGDDPRKHDHEGPNIEGKGGS